MDKGTTNCRQDEIFLMIVLVALPLSVSSMLIMSVRVVQQSVACIPNTAEHARPMPCSTVVQVYRSAQHNCTAISMHQVSLSAEVYD